ncbi:outer membrane protein assembly factor BamE [Candidatus Atribacteria bacterium 1244-E10-H5-B2]|nr:MAG: outer membrane protein assembly factor BamE [Candidatus Atribacteria bacterium 1244-E10-H5-B2]
MKFKRSYVSWIIFAIGIALTAHYFYQKAQRAIRKESIASLKVGDTKQAVRSKLGEPRQIRKSGSGDTWSYGQKFYHLMITFDKAGKVVIYVGYDFEQNKVIGPKRNK